MVTPIEQRQLGADELIDAVAAGESQQAASRRLAPKYGVAPRTVIYWAQTMRSEDLLAVTNQAARDRVARANSIQATFSLERQRHGLNLLGMKAEKAFTALVKRADTSIAELNEATLLLARLVQVDRNLDMKGAPVLGDEPERDDERPAPEALRNITQIRAAFGREG